MREITVLRKNDNTTIGIYNFLEHIYYNQKNEEKYFFNYCLILNELLWIFKFS